jgi:hypothetical protein
VEAAGEGAGEAIELPTAAPGGCAAHGVALLLASTAAVVLMAAMTFGCWLLYRLVA